MNRTGTAKAKNKHSIAPAICSQSCNDYFDYESKILSLFGFVFDAVKTIDKHRQIASAALAYDPIAEQQGEKPKQPEEKLELTKHYYKYHMPLMKEFLLVRLVDNYQKYLADILFEIFINKPETLKSSAQVEVSEVLAAGTMDNFVRQYAEKKVDNLTHESFIDLQRFFEERFKIEISDKTKAIRTAIAIRNISVHNRCIINKRYLQSTGESENNLGKAKEIDNEFLKNLIDLLPKSAVSIDVQVRKKFGVKGKKFMASVQQKLVSNK